MNEQVQPAGGPLFNPLSPDFIRNPYPHYDRLRAIDPIHVTPAGCACSFMVTSNRLPHDTNTPIAAPLPGVTIP